MENASKALIIAGAILLAILLISLGIMIFNQAQSTVNEGGMSQAAKEAFNNKWLKYEGTQKGSVVKSLINEVNVNNGDTSTPNVTLSGKNSTSAVATTTNYTVTLTYGSTGVVSQIEIK